MSSHRNNKGNHKGHNHSPMKHMLHMIICCGLPIVIVGFLPVIARFSPSAGSLIGKIVPFLCPLMMVGMMVSMFGGSKKKSCCEDTNENQISSGKSIE